MGEIFCFDIRQIDFTRGTQQPLSVMGMGVREKVNEGHQPEWGNQKVSWLQTLFMLVNVR